MNRAILRRGTLRWLEGLSRLLIKRFGSHTTLGEMRAAIIAQQAIYAYKPLTVTEIARRSGQPKQSVSRWAKRVPWLVLKDKPNDGRSKVIDCEDRERLVSYADEIALMIARLVDSYDGDPTEIRAALKKLEGVPMQMPRH